MIIAKNDPDHNKRQKADDDALQRVLDEQNEPDPLLDGRVFWFEAPEERAARLELLAEDPAAPLGNCS